MKARLLLKKKVTDEDGDLLEWDDLESAAPVRCIAKGYAIVGIYPQGIGYRPCSMITIIRKGITSILKSLEQPFSFRGKSASGGFEYDVRT